MNIKKYWRMGYEFKINGYTLINLAVGILLMGVNQVYSISLAKNPSENQNIYGYQNNSGKRDVPFLSNLKADGDDPIFTTYAAPLERSEYIVDEGYQFKFYENDRPIEMVTDHAGSMGLVLTMDGKTHYKLSDMASKPVITTSYSDLVKYQFRPFQKIRVNVFFQVYSSHFAIQHITVTNNGANEAELSIYPYLKLPESTTNLKMQQVPYYTFEHRQEPDGWTDRKGIPHQTRRRDIFLADQADPQATYASVDINETGQKSLIAHIKNSLSEPLEADSTGVLVFKKTLRLKPGKHQEIRIIRGVDDRDIPVHTLIDSAKNLLTIDMNRAVERNEELYASIPKIMHCDRVTRLMYWSAFNLIRQCMLPSEGETSYNHYVYSREPTWGWGHAGQVFHESLSMLAYVFMDPQSAEDSQRLYMQRQWDNGYIEYRAGPYFDAMNYTHGDFTSSAPWFNYENWEIYKVSNDKDFLREVYDSGVSFYKWWLRRRDQDQDGLAEWGGQAILESVRDAQVAVWKYVGWPSNFEAPELNAMLVQEARSLSKMARELGKKKAYRYWKKEAEQRSEKIKKTFWDPKTGFFYYVDKNDEDFTFKKSEDLKRQSIIGFIPMWSGSATRQQVKNLMRTLTDTTKFWRTYGIPSLAADDSFYHPKGYWNGPVWIPWQYLVMHGLLNYGYKKEAEELSSRVFTNVIANLKKNHTFWEFYSPDKKWGGHHQTYIWSGLVARMLIDLNAVQ